MTELGTNTNFAESNDSKWFISMFTELCEGNFFDQMHSVFPYKPSARTLNQKSHVQADVATYYLQSSRTKCKVKLLKGFPNEKQTKYRFETNPKDNLLFTVKMLTSLSKKDFKHRSS